MILTDNLRGYHDPDHSLHPRIHSEQTICHQRTQAEAAGYKIYQVVSDEGVSSVMTKLADRPEGKRLFDILRTGDVLVARWVDRLGRNYQDVTDTIRLLMRKCVIIRTVINDMTFDGATTDPVQESVRDALIAFMAATAQANAEATKEAQKAGIEAARGDERKYLGRKPSYTQETLSLVTDMLSQGARTSEIARSASMSRQTVLRIKADPVAAQEVLARWAYAS